MYKTDDEVDDWRRRRAHCAQIVLGKLAFLRYTIYSITAFTDEIKWKRWEKRWIEPNIT